MNLFMFSEYKFSFPLPDGLHARPASIFAEAASAFTADIYLVCERTGISADAKSMLAMIGADIRKGDICRLEVTGADEAAAHTALRELIELVLPFSDEPLPAAPLPSGCAALPRCLQSLNPPFVSGTVIHHGVGQGSIVFIRGLVFPEKGAPSAVRSPVQEEAALDKAVGELRIQIENQLAGHTASAAAILRAHLSVLSDSAFLGKLRSGIHEQGSAEQSVIEAGRHFMSLLASGGGSIRERAVDIEEVCLHLLRNLSGKEELLSDARLTEPSVVAADRLGPRQLLELDRIHLKGLVVEEMSPASHAAILARAFDIPTLSGIKIPARYDGRQVVVDAQQGILILSPDETVRRYYQKEAAARSQRNGKLAQSARTPAVTADGVRIEVAANISTAEEVDRAVALGAEGIGLFRTEMLYVSRDSAPTEDIQVEIYRKALLQADGRTVIIRTFDIGGDKPVPYMRLPEEDNPFLGYRGVRIYREYLELFETQLRAILRASVFGKVRLLIPMVSSVEDLLWVRERIVHLHGVLKTEGIAFDAEMEVGVMIETPAAVFSVRTLSGAADFFSIGTNDLSQYFFAADRTNGRVAGLCRVRDPAFLRLLSYAVTEAQACGKWIGLCGEMAHDPVHLPLLVGIGFHEISVGANRIPQLKRAVSALQAEGCRALLEKCLICSSAGEVESLLSQMTGASDAQLLDADLIRLDSDSATKEEAIRELVNALYVSGRTDDPSAVEEAVWDREAVGVTGVGFGFGIPHCKSDAIKSHSIGIARFRQPVSWNPDEDEPVRMIILLALRKADSGTLHMKIFSKLARKLMHDSFRGQLLEAGTEQKVVSFLNEELEL
ncbi:MAG: phosphoenolpyruvate--protein phosphotransferase [Pontiellaceae bacterium]|jgi:fructose-specific PTS system IIA-like component|nr:phosphoenolpyruvate--protein phosphotransferase [Pontiellaceae bacterium]